MNRRLKIAVSAVTVVGVAAIWGWGLASEDTAAAKKFLISPPQSFGSPILTSFRLGPATSRFIFWVTTPTGREFVHVVVDKRNGQVALVD